MKALVLEKRGDLAAVLREDGVYTTTKQPCEVGETIELTAEIVAFPHRRKQWTRIAVAAVLAVVLFTGSYSYLTTTSYAYVSLDSGDTSVEVSVNRMGRVISVDPLNEGSAETAQTLAPELHGMRIEEALPQAMERIRPDGPRDDPDAYMIAGVTSGNERRREELTETVQQAAGRLDGEKPTVYTFDVPPEERREAEHSGMSGGRFAFEQRGMPPPAQGEPMPAGGQPPADPAMDQQGDDPPPMPRQDSVEVPGAPPREAPPAQGGPMPAGGQPPAEPATGHADGEGRPAPDGPGDPAPTDMEYGEEGQSPPPERQ